MAARLKEKYHKEIKQALQKELGLDNPMAVPALDKIVINMGLGEATGNTKLLDPLVANLAEIAGAESHARQQWCAPGDPFARFVRRGQEGGHLLRA